VTGATQPTARMAAMGGLRSFTRTRPGGEVAPIPAVRGTETERRDSTSYVQVFGLLLSDRTRMVCIWPRPHSVKEEVDDESWVVYPQIELGGDTGAVKAFAQAAEDLGCDHIVIYDHVLGAVHAGREPKLTGPYKETDPFTSRWSPTLTSPASPRTSD
jgi:hypothetical protein